MGTLEKLKFVCIQADRKSPVVLRRNRLTGKLAHQISLAKATVAGDVYVAKKVKFVADSVTGKLKQVEISTRVKPWWFTAPSGKTVLAVRYGQRNLEIVKGKNAIEFNGMDDLLATLEVIKEAVHAGELDAQIEQASGALRAGLIKKKK